MFDFIMAQVRSAGLKAFIMSSLLLVTTLFLFYGDACTDGEVTSDTQLDWSSCEATAEDLYPERVRFIHCDEPTAVWLAVRRDEELEPEEISAGGAFNMTNKHLPGIMSTSMSLLQLSVYEPWEGISGRSFKRVIETTGEVRGYGGAYSFKGEDASYAIKCLSRTDSLEMCENIVDTIQRGQLTEKLR